MSTAKDSRKNSTAVLQEMRDKLDSMTPERRAKVIRGVAMAVMLKQAREETGQTDLTKPFVPPPGFPPRQT